jgi:hypothetical protein
LLMFGLFIPMNWGAPQGNALVVRYSVSIVPDVAGEVLDVPVEPNQPLKAGNVLFRIDPTPYQSQVNALAAQLKFHELRLEQMQKLAGEGSGRAFDVEQRQVEVDQLKAQVVGAQWNLDKTVVRAPADGYVTNLTLRKGARVANMPMAPVMAFIDTSETIIGVEILQIDARYMSPASRSRSPSNSCRARSTPARSTPCCRRSPPGSCRRQARRWPRRRSSRRRSWCVCASTIRTSPVPCRPVRPAPPRSSPGTSSRRT